MPSPYSMFFRLIFMAVAWTAVAGCAPDPPDTDSINISQALSKMTEQPCFRKADTVIPIRFPDDAGPHNDFQTEWWYYTGNLTGPGGRRFGFQLTFFRRALSCETPQGQSLWRTRQLYMAHFALTDVQKNTFAAEQRMSRQSLDIAGASAAPFHVWTDNWEAMETNGVIRLNAQGTRAGIDLALSPLKPVVLQGRNGLSMKSPSTGSASYYYSLPRNRVHGVVRTPEGEFHVTGLAWFDHEWSTSALDPDQSGWDWFSFHLDDGRDIMVCQVRHAVDASRHFLFGSLTSADGQFQILDSSGIAITVTDHWKSPATRRVYPSAWRISLPGKGLDVRVTPMISAQEHALDFVYWEGGVDIQSPLVSGSGYAELTGYR